MRCRYCYVRKTSKSMPLNVGIHSLRFFLDKFDSERFEIVFFGGEPLLQFDMIKDIISHGNQFSKEYGKTIRFTVITNGTLITKDIINYLNKENINLKISIDGSKNTHNFNRKLMFDEPSYEIIERKIPLLQTLSGRVAVSYTITRDTVKYFSNNIQYLLQKGFNSIFINIFEEELWSTQSLKILEEQLQSISMLYLKKIINGSKFYLNIFDYYFLKHNNKGVMRRPCRAGLRLFAVSTTGQIFPCYRFLHIEAGNQFLLGNVLDQKFDISKLKKFRCFDVRKNKSCLNCSIKGECYGKCYAHNYIMNKDITLPSRQACIIRKQIIDRCLWIKKNLVHFRNVNPSSDLSTLH